MNDLMSAKASFGESARISETLSIPLLDEEHSLAPFMEQFGRVQHELQSIDECLANLKQTHEESKSVLRADALRAMKESIEKNIDIILVKARSIQSMLDDLSTASNMDQTMPDINAPGVSLNRIKTCLTNGMTKSLKDRLILLDNLRTNIAEDYREIVERHYYIVFGQNPNAETVDQLIESGQSQDLVHQAIVGQGREEVANSIVDIEEKYQGIKEIEHDLQELHQIFMDMSTLVLDQTEELNDIEKNMVESAYAVAQGVVQLGGAKEEERKKFKRIWGALVLLLMLLVVVAVILVILNLNRGSKA
eukprot:Gb_12333 [translate_table: standard]